MKIPQDSLRPDRIGVLSGSQTQNRTSILNHFFSYFRTRVCKTARHDKCHSWCNPTKIHLCSVLFHGGVSEHGIEFLVGRWAALSALLFREQGGVHGPRLDSKLVFCSPLHIANSSCHTKGQKAGGEEGGAR